MAMLLEPVIALRII